MDKEIKETMDYGIFKVLDGNRDIDLKHVDVLVDSMKVNYTPVPLLVNPNMEILDGQHRLEACKKLNLPVYYIVVNYDLDDTKKLNSTQKRWMLIDYVKSYAKHNVAYKQLLELIETFPEFSVCKIVEVTELSKHRASMKCKKGTYETTWAEIQNAKKRLGEMVRFKGFFNFYNNSIFMRAYFNVSKKEGFDADLFFHKALLAGNKFRLQPTTKDFVVMFDSIYNKRARKKVDLTSFDEDANNEE